MEKEDGVAKSGIDFARIMFSEGLLIVESIDKILEEGKKLRKEIKALK